MNLPEKPKILIDIERMKYPFTGLYYYCLNLSLNLLKYHSDKFDFYFFAHTKTKLPGFFKRIPVKLFHKIFLNTSGKYQLWHTTWQDTKYFPSNKIKLVYTIHDLNFLYTSKPEQKKQKLLASIQKKINRADAITTISHFVKQDIENNLNLNGKSVEVIYNGVELIPYPDFDAPKYKPSNKFLFTLGTVLYKKHFHVLPRLLAENDFELIIAGIHPDKKYLEKIIKEAEIQNVRERVHLIGAINDQEKYWYYNHCEAFVFPSISEGFGLPPVEAMQLGKPVFLSTYTSLPEIGGKYAYYFQDFEPDSMRKTLKEGLKDYKLNNRKNEIINWAKQFTWQEAVKKYVKIYQNVLQLPENIKPYPVKRQKVTAIIPTFNEEKNIAYAIAQVQWADEILVIDSHSTDKTVKIAKNLNVRVIKRHFDNYSNQKNFAIKQAENDWIFVLDADERIPEELKYEILEKLENNTKEKAFWIPRINYFLHKKVKYSGWQNDKVIRLFNRQYAGYNGRLVHEEIQCQTKIGYLTNPLIHYTCNDYKKYKSKVKKYSKLKAIELYNHNKKVNIFHRIFKPPYRIIYHYFYKLGFLDGKVGWQIAYLSAFGMAERYKELKKLYEDEK